MSSAIHCFLTHLKRFLTRKGYTVFIAPNAREARLEMQRCYPDVAILDLRLPDADGAKLMASLKSAYPETRFIVMTAFGSIRSAVDSTKLGAIEYLTKPFDLATMESRTFDEKSLLAFFTTSFCSALISL